MVSWVQQEVQDQRATEEAEAGRGLRASEVSLVCPGSGESRGRRGSQAPGEIQG